MINRRNFLKAAGAGIATTALPTFTEAQKQDRKPNIIFIMVDDMGYADLGCYGSKVIQTPNIDRLAAEGIKFTDAYSGSAVCGARALHTVNWQAHGTCFATRQYRWGFRSPAMKSLSRKS